MPRRSGIWLRANRGWYCTIRGKQIALGHDEVAAEKEFHRLMSLDEPLEANQATVRAIALKFLQAKAKEVKLPTYVSYDFAIQRFVRRYGSRKAVDMRPFHVDDWLDLYPTWGKSSRGLNATIVKLLFSWAKRKGYISSNDIRDTKAEGIAKRKPSTVDEFEALIAASTHPAFTDFLIVLYDTGCRPGEIRSLEASTIDFERSVATVNGKTGPRDVGLTERAVGILKRNAKVNQRGPVLRSPPGTPWAKSTLVHYLTKARKACGHHVVFYDSRHRFWERARAGGADSVDIAKNQGWVDLKQLVARYAHPTPSQLRGVVKAASRRKKATGRRKTHG